MNISTILALLACFRLVQGWTVWSVRRTSISSPCIWVQTNIVPPGRCQRPTRSSARWLSASAAGGSLNSLGKDEAAWKKEGERIILEAAVKAGASPEMIRIEWKSGRVVVTVDGTAYLAAEDTYENMEFDIDDDDDKEEFDYESYADDFLEEDDLVDEPFLEDAEEEQQSGVDVVSIAKAINAAFEEEGEGSVGYNIAVHHELEVTTPGATDELSGIMFESYKGFDVIVDTIDAKTGKHKKVEGKLVEKTDEFIQINQKGRMRKFKNELVESVKLPKAKKEKGDNKKKKK